VFLERAENEKFPGFGFLRQTKTAPWGVEIVSRSGKPEPEYLHRHPDFNGKPRGGVYPDTLAELDHRTGQVG
jgi:hypothetical protein